MARQFDYSTIASLKQYENDAVAAIALADGVVPSKPGGKPRGAILSFSGESRRRFRLLVRNCGVRWRAFITLTYPSEFPWDIRESKGHLNGFLQFLRRREARYVWVMEFQRRGAVHYHLVVDQFIHYSEVARTWASVCKSDDPKHLQAGTSIEGVRKQAAVCGYLLKYLTKSEQKHYPGDTRDPGRWWGATRGMLSVQKEYRARTSYRLAVRGLRVLRKYAESQLRYCKAKLRHKDRFTAWGGSRIVERIAPYIMKIWKGDYDGGICVCEG